MKKLNQNKIIIPFLFLSFSVLNNKIFAQDDPVVTENVLKLHYYNSNNSVQYLLVQTNLKTGKKIEPHKNVNVQLFLDSNSAANLIAKITTDDNGRAKAFLPVSLKTIWDASSKHKFIAVPEASGKEEATPIELEITKSRITLDTISDGSARSIKVIVEQNDKDKWVPVKDVEMKIGVERLGSILSAGEAATYTTDSSGTITVEFKKDSLPGDEQGNFVLAAKADDNDQLGNLLAEKKVQWGVVEKIDNNFFKQRTLWTTRFRTPFWLLIIAYSIVISVWSTLLYLVFQFIKVRKMGINPTLKSVD